MKRPFQIIAGMVVLGAFVMLGCEAGDATQAPNNETTAPKAEKKTDELKAQNAETTKALDQQKATAVADQAVKAAAVVKEAEQKALVCSLVGNAGDTVSCPIRLASGEVGAAARALQATLLYDASMGAFDGFFDEVCNGSDCVEKEIAEANPALSATGHTLNIGPRAKAAWNGRGSFILINVMNPKQAISTANVDAPAGIMAAKFVLKRNATERTPFIVDMSKVVAADEAASELNVSLVDSTIVTGAVK